MSCWTSALIRFLGTVPWSRNGSPMMEPTVFRGLSEAYGSWKTICMSRRSVPELPPFRLRDVVAVEPDLPLGRVVEPHHDAGERRLPAAGLADEPDRLARVDLEIDAVDRVHVADVLLEQDPLGDREVLLDALRS